MARKKIGVLSIMAGVFLILLFVIWDLLKGEAFVIGRRQAVMIALGAVLTILGVILAFTRFLEGREPFTFFEKYLSKIGTWLSLKCNTKIFDIAVIVAFIIFAMLCALGRWNGISPFIYLGSDASYISSYAAVLDHPGQFVSDYLLSNQSNALFYFAVHIPIIRFLSRFAGSYGNAFLVILPITIFLKLFGFYFLGKRLFKNNGLALLLTVAAFPVVATGAWDYWGLLGDALPRNLFEIILPWLILYSIRWIDKPKRWYWLSLILGLFTYVHSISAGIIFFTISLVLLIQSKKSFVKRISQLALNILIYLITTVPFIINYLATIKYTQTIPISYQDSLLVLNMLFGSNHLDTLAIFINLIKQLTVSGILPLTMIALLFLFILHKIRVKGAYRVLGVWILGILIVCVIFPLLEKLADPWLHMVSFRMMLVRGFRYFPPLLLVFTFLAFFDQKEPSGNRFPANRGLFFVVLICISIALTISNNPQNHYADREIKCLFSGHVVCPTTQELDGADIIKSLSTYTNKNDRILTIPPLNVSFSNAIRYQALRPAGYSYADATRLSNDPGLLKEVLVKMKPWSELEHADADTVLASYLSLAPDVQADYLIVQLDDFTPESVINLPFVYANDHYALVSVKK